MDGGAPKVAINYAENSGPSLGEDPFKCVFSRFSVSPVLLLFHYSLGSADPQSSSLVRPPGWSEAPPWGIQATNFCSRVLICGWQEQFDCIAVGLTATHRYEFVTQDGEGTRWGKSIAHLHVSWAAGRSEWPRVARMDPADVEKQDFCHLRQRACKCRSCGGPLCLCCLGGPSLTRTESVDRPCLPSARSDVRRARVHVQK